MRALVIASAFVTAVACAPAPTAGVEAQSQPKAEPKAEPAPKPAPAPVAEPASPPAPKSPPTSIPAHGLASLELVCELIVKVAAPAGRHSCKPERGVFDEQQRAGLLTAVSDLSYDFPVIASEAGWSVFPPVLHHWGGGTEINLERTGVEFQSWPSDAYGELLVIDIAAVTTDDYEDWTDEEQHWRKIICAPGGATPRCTYAILYRVERAKLRGESREPVSSYSAKLALDGDELVVEAKPDKLTQLYVDEAGFLSPGRHSLAKLFAANESVWSP